METAREVKNSDSVYTCFVMRPGDWLGLLLIGCLALVLFLHGLGDLNYPRQGYVVPEGGVTVDVAFESERELAWVNFYEGQGETEVTLTYRGSERWHPLPLRGESVSLDDFYKLVDKRLGVPVPATALRVRLEGAGSVVNELALFDAQGRRIAPQRLVERRPDQTRQGDNPALHPLFDEQDAVKRYGGYASSTYFDEIYHGRTAYEFVSDIHPYEYTHPPLGKSLIALGVRAFGMSPFGMRVMPAMAGVLTVLMLFAGGRLLTGTRVGAYLAAGLGMFEFSVFVINRYATIDGFLGLFTLCAFLALFKWYAEDRGQVALDKLPWLGAAGASLGLAASVKWNALYAGLGITVLGLVLLGRWVGQLRGSKEPSARVTARARIARLVLAGVVVFVVVPAGIYYLSYVEYIQALNESLTLFSVEGVRAVVAEQARMFDYHTQLSEPHAYASAFYTWPLMLKPLWLFVDTTPTGLRSSITLLGNPAIWWPGLLVMVGLAWAALWHRNVVGAFLVGGYLAFFLPWAAIGRVTFIYHYYPCALLLMLGIAYALSRLDYSRAWNRRLLLAYGVSVVLLFALFYPAISGHPTDPDYFDILHWLPDWGMM